jgi:hypothetical protein
MLVERSHEQTEDRQQEWSNAPQCCVIARGSTREIGEQSAEQGDSDAEDGEERSNA